MNKIEYAEFPSVYQASDTASVHAQKTYLQLMGFDLLTMLSGALLAIYNFQSETAKLYLYIIAAALLCTSIVLTALVKIQKREDTWYQGRALAESAKTLTWRFVTCAENFENTLPASVVEEKFIGTINELSGKFEKLHAHMNAKLLALPMITDKLRQARALGWEERKQFYIENRIREQKNWYAEKAEINKQKQNRWFLVVIASQILSLACAVFLIIHPECNWNFVGFFTTLSSAGLAWLQLKQHQELKQAYTTATQELNSIEALSYNINSEESLRRFVIDSENAISREHTLWFAQRRK